ncbi:Ribosomal protein S18 acetylase RimI [Halogranum rubrum]|uniref:Ribosomal protein S18 acetylase RimI n=1 Tax=Halogranum rubrum TaxID=553466 RepID=A0A1I4EHK9_9EURY|nr:GNAT family N-acetyltransferase [Halogranum rubrum]SFL05232.1 Ribosomal protein S18 acetylase RimI [Halogranum rubrum]
MELREATAADIEQIRQVARDSLMESYSHALDESVIDESVDEWYGDDLTDELDRDDVVYLVADDDGTVTGFSQSYLVGRDGTNGQISWLHVSPDARGSGLGSRLLTRTEEVLVDHGATRLSGKVLTVNKAGAEFYEGHGYEEGDTRKIDLGAESFTERTYLKFPGTEGEQQAPLDPRQVDDTTVYVAFDESDRGSTAPLYVAYLDEGREERYGYFCGHCESFEVSMDAMGRVVCSDCGNKRRPSRWDASYL